MGLYGIETYIKAELLLILLLSELNHSPLTQFPSMFPTSAIIQSTLAPRK